MNTQDMLLCDLLQCGSLDLEFLLDLYDANDIDLERNIEQARELSNGKIEDINVLIYQAFDSIAQQFLREQSEVLFERTGYSEVYPPEYEIYTNYLDSHFWFRSAEVQTLFDEWSESRRLTQEQQLMQRMRQ